MAFSFFASSRSRRATAAASPLWSPTGGDTYKKAPKPKLQKTTHTPLSSAREIELFISADQAAVILGKSVSMVTYLCRNGSLQAKKIGGMWQIYREDLERIQRGSADLPNLDLWRFAAFGIASWPAYREDWLSGSETKHHLAASPAPIDADGKRTNAWGVSDLIGNVWEWCTNDIMTHRTGLRALQLPKHFRPEPDPVVCGGGFLDDLSEISIFIRAAELRDGTSTFHSDLGFRVAGRIALSELPSEVRIHLSNLPKEDWAKGDVVFSTPDITGGGFSRRSY